MVAPSCPGSVLVSFHHTNGRARALDPLLAHSAGNNVLLTPPSSRCLYPLNSFSLNNSLPRSVASSSHTPPGFLILTHSGHPDSDEFIEEYRR